MNLYIANPAAGMLLIIAAYVKYTVHTGATNRSAAFNKLDVESHH